MSKNITIAEDGIAKIFENVKKIKTNLLDSGSTFWVPEDEIIAYYGVGGDNVTDYFESNIFDYKCTPNLEMIDGKPSWTIDSGGIHYYTCSNTSALRGCVVINNTSIYFKEQQLETASDYTKLTTQNIQPCVINDKQVYYVEITGGEHPFEQYTFVPPTERIVDIETEIAEMYKVYTRKVTNEFIKAQFSLISNSTSSTYDVELILGTGNADGFGQGIIKKDTDGLDISYSARNDGVQRGIYITDDSINLKEDSYITPIIPTHVVDFAPESPIDGHLYFVKTGG